jgi:hypothetical protein
MGNRAARFTQADVAISPVAIFSTMIAAPITSAGRRWPLGPVGCQILAFCLKRGARKSLQSHAVPTTAKNDPATNILPWITPVSNASKYRT